jgi:hypothetical protein
VALLLLIEMSIGIGPLAVACSLHNQNRIHAIVQECTQYELVLVEMCDPAVISHAHAHTPAEPHLPARAPDHAI